MQGVTPPIIAALSAAMVNSEAREVDQFARDIVPPVSDGDAFKIVVACDDGNRPGSSGDCYWTYDGSKLSFRALVSRAPGQLITTPVFRFVSLPKYGKPYVAQNAFGVRARVSVEYDRDFAIAPLSGALPSADVVVSGDAARKLTATTRLVITGTITKLKTGGLTDCAVYRSSPEIDSPEDNLTRTCWIGVNILDAHYVDVSTGAQFGAVN